MLFLLKDGSTVSLAKRDLTDVGISGALHTGVGFFGLLNAVSASLPCGWGGHERRGPEIQRFHVLHSIRERLGPLCYTGSSVSARRATFDDPDSTACLLAPALNSLVWLGSLSRCLRAFTGLTLSPDSSASPGLRLPGLLHYREGFTPLTVAPTSGPPIRRMLPWSTCGHTQGLVRIAPAKQYRLQLHVTTSDSAHVESNAACDHELALV